MSADEFSALLDKLPWRPRSVALNGVGEPLLNPDFFAIVDALAARGINCSFFTNGTLISDSVRAGLVARPNIVFVGISCDGATERTFETLRRGARFDDWKGRVAAFVRGARSSPKQQMEIVLSTVISKLNLGEIEGIVILANRLGISRVHFSGMVINSSLSARIAVGDAELSGVNCDSLEALGKAVGVQVGFSWRNKHAWPKLNCFQPWEYVQITAEGRMVPCCAVLERSGGFVVGDLAAASFEEVWRGPILAAFRSTSVRGSNAICNACPYY